LKAFFWGKNIIGTAFACIENKCKLETGKYEYNNKLGLYPENFKN
jgi:hypothetical protein